MSTIDKIIEAGMVDISDYRKNFVQELIGIKQESEINKERDWCNELIEEAITDIGKNIIAYRLLVDFLKYKRVGVVKTQGGWGDFSHLRSFYRDIGAKSLKIDTHKRDERLVNKLCEEYRSKQPDREYGVFYKIPVDIQLKGREKQIKALNEATIRYDYVFIESNCCAGCDQTFFEVAREAEITFFDRIVYICKNSEGLSNFYRDAQIKTAEVEQSKCYRPEDYGYRANRNTFVELAKVIGLSERMK